MNKGKDKEYESQQLQNKCSTKVKRIGKGKQICQPLKETQNIKRNYQSSNLQQKKSQSNSDQKKRKKPQSQRSQSENNDQIVEELDPNIFLLSQEEIHCKQESQIILNVLLSGILKWYNKSKNHQQKISQQINKTQLLLSSEKIQKKRINLSLYQDQEYQKDTIDYLLKQDKKIYQCHPYYMHKQQLFLDKKKREMLIDWMMEVSDEFHLKRQTFQLSVYFVDKYLEQRSNILLERFQLIGTAAISIAAKIEEIYPPQLKDLEIATDSGFSVEQISQAEIDMLTKLQWYVNPTTINSWANIYMQQWNNYVNSNPLGLTLLDPQYLTYETLPLFKTEFQSRHNLFSFTMQILDFTIFDLDYLKFSSNHLALSAIIVTLGLEVEKYTINQVLDQFKNKIDFVSEYLTDPNCEYSNMITDFIENIIQIKITELKASISFICKFLIIKYQSKLPSFFENKSVATQEEFYSFQPYYSNIPDCLENLICFQKHHNLL